MVQGVKLIAVTVTPPCILPLSALDLIWSQLSPVGTTSPSPSCMEVLLSALVGGSELSSLPGMLPDQISLSAPQAPVHLRLLWSSPPLLEKVIYLLPPHLLFHWRCGQGTSRVTSASMDAVDSLTSLLLVVFTHMPPSQPHPARCQTPDSLCLPDHQLRYPTLCPPALSVLHLPGGALTLEPLLTWTLPQSPPVNPKSHCELPGVPLQSPKSTLSLTTALLHPLLSSFPHILPPSCQLQTYPDLMEKIFKFSLNNFF